MHRVVLLSLAAATISACEREEHWYSYVLSERDVTFSESVYIDAHVTVPADAWPQQEAVFEQSVRICMDGLTGNSRGLLRLPTHSSGTPEQP